MSNKKVTSKLGRKTKGFGMAGTDPTTPTSVLPKLLKQARQSGQLNLSGRGFSSVPDCVWRINVDLPAEAEGVDMNESGERWWDQPDLTKLFLATNSLTTLSEDIALLPALVVLDVRDNELSSLPKALGELKELKKAYLSHNKLQLVPPELGRMTNLTTLMLQHNSLTELCHEIGDLQCLEELNVANNKLSELPPNIGHLRNLFKLNIAHNNLRSLPMEFGDLRCLRVLEASFNNLEILPSELGNLHHLEQLHLDHNNLTTFPALVNCSGLKELLLGNNCLSELTKENLAQLPSVSVLDLRDNKVSVLPDEIICLERLERLILANNNLSGLPLCLGNMDHLKSVVLEGNPIKLIRRNILMGDTNEIKKYLRSLIKELPTPATESNCPAITKTPLDTESNCPAITKTPLDTESNCPAITETPLDTESNCPAITKTPLDTESKCPAITKTPLDTESNCPAITETPLDTESNCPAITETPLDTESNCPAITKTPLDTESKCPAIKKTPLDVIGDHGGLDVRSVRRFKTLDYSNKGVSTVPDGIWEVVGEAGVFQVNLNKNTLTELPNRLNVVVDSLKELSLGYNRLTSVHPDIGHFLKLTTLDLRNNSLNSLPSQMSSLQNLRELTLSYNRFQEVPQVIYSLQKLEILFVADNKIQVIDVTGLLKLSKLTTLNLQNNDIAQVPPELGNCVWLKSLMLGGNSFRNPRNAILAKGTPAVLEYLRTRIAN